MNQNLDMEVSLMQRLHMLYWNVLCGNILVSADPNFWTK